MTLPPESDSQAIALDLARKATQLQIAIAGAVFPRQTDPVPSVTGLTGEIISKADLLRRRAPQEGRM